MSSAEAMDSANPRFVCVYGLIGADLGVQATGDADHKAQIWQTIFSNNAFTVKGPKVSLRRWLGWLESSELHLPIWHSRLFAIVMLGQTLGVYCDWTDVALFKEKCEWVHAKADDEILCEGGDDGHHGFRFRC